MEALPELYLFQDLSVQFFNKVRTHNERQCVLWRSSTQLLGIAAMTKGYEDATAFLGEWRRFQQMIFFLLTIAMVPNGLIVFGVVFVADIPEHSCRVPEVNLSQEWRDAVIPVVVKCDFN